MTTPILRASLVTDCICSFHNLDAPTPTLLFGIIDGALSCASFASGPSGRCHLANVSFRQRVIITTRSVPWRNHVRRRACPRVLAAAWPKRSLLDPLSGLRQPPLWGHGCGWMTRNLVRSRRARDRNTQHAHRAASPCGFPLLDIRRCKRMMAEGEYAILIFLEHREVCHPEGAWTGVSIKVETFGGFAAYAAGVRRTILYLSAPEQCVARLCQLLLVVVLKSALKNRSRANLGLRA